MDDPRNLVDDLKGLPHQQIIQRLDQRGVELEVAMENLTRDYNMGTIVRTANACGVRRVHIVGRRQWNRRGAMVTDRYLTVVYHADVATFVTAMARDQRTIVAVDNVPGATGLATAALPRRAVLVFGSEGPGLSDALLAAASLIVAIEQRGSTRSINVGVAAGIVMYAWLHQHYLVAGH